MLGYLDSPEADAATFTSDGWIRTGDIGLIDTHGNLRITDRLKELIKVRFCPCPAFFSSSACRTGQRLPSHTRRARRRPLRLATRRRRRRLRYTRPSSSQRKASSLDRSDQFGSFDGSSSTCGRVETTSRDEVGGV